MTLKNDRAYQKSINWILILQFYIKFHRLKMEINENWVQRCYQHWGKNLLPSPHSRNCIYIEMNNKNKNSMFQCFLNVFSMLNASMLIDCFAPMLCSILKKHSTLFTKQRASSERVCFKIWALRKFLTYNSVQIRDNKREWKWDGAEKKSADNLFYDAALEETDTHIHTHNMNW